MSTVDESMTAAVSTEWTGTEAMMAAMREADRRATVLAAVSDRLAEDGWTIDPMISGADSGITASRDGVAIMIYGDGKVVSSDLMATIYGEAVVKVAAEEMS